MLLQVSPPKSFVLITENKLGKLEDRHVEKLAVG